MTEDELRFACQILVQGWWTTQQPLELQPHLRELERLRLARFSERRGWLLTARGMQLRITQRSKGSEHGHQAHRSNTKYR